MHLRATQRPLRINAGAAETWGRNGLDREVPGFHMAGSVIEHRVLETPTPNCSINCNALLVASSKDSQDLQRFEPRGRFSDQFPKLVSESPERSCRPKSNKIHAYNSSALSVNAAVRPGASEIHIMPNVTDSETVNGATVSIHAGDKASLYQSLPNGPRTIRTELFAGNRLLESHLDEKATNCQTFQRRGDLRWRTITCVRTTDGKTGQTIRVARIAHKPESRFWTVLEEHQQVMSLQL